MNRRAMLQRRIVLFFVALTVAYKVLRLSVDVKTNSVLCMVMTSEKNILTRGRAVYETWGAECSRLLFVCNCPRVQTVGALKAKSKEIPRELAEFEGITHFPVVQVNVTEDRRRMGLKVLAALRESYMLFGDYDWYFMLDDDAYVFTDNLYKFINTKDSTEPLMYGFHFRHRPLPAGHIGGGPGILLTRESMKRLVAKIVSNECQRFVDTYGDVTIGACGYAAGIHIGNSTDHFGRPRFHFYDPDIHYHGPVPHYLFRDGVHDKKTGKECCSLETISFHYVKIAKMYEIHANKTFLETLLS